MGSNPTGGTAVRPAESPLSSNMLPSRDLALSGGVRPTPAFTGCLCHIRAKVQPSPERGGDATTGRVLLAGDALGVDLQQHGDAVTGPLGDLGRRHAGVEPGRHRRVPQVVGPARERRRDLLGRSARRPGPCRQVRQYVLSASSPPRTPRNSSPSGPVPNVFRCACSRTVSSGGHGDHAGLTLGPVLQLALLTPPPAVGSRRRLAAARVAGYATTNRTRPIPGTCTSTATTADDDPAW